MNGGGSAATLSSSPTALEAGATIDFVVGFGNGSDLYDSTGLFASVTQMTSVPEPQSLITFVIGVMGAIVISRCRKTT